MSWRWVNRQALLLLHAESLAEHGGATGLRDAGLLDSALARAQNLATYGEPDSHPDYAQLAAAYGFGLAKNLTFVDGNKHAPLLATGLFLALNGYRLKTTQADATLTFLALAAGEIDETAFANWIRTRCVKR